MYELIGNDGPLVAFVTTVHKSHRGVSKNDLRRLIDDLRKGLAETTGGQDRFRERNREYMVKLQKVVEELDRAEGEGQGQEVGRRAGVGF